MHFLKHDINATMDEKIFRNLECVFIKVACEDLQKVHNLANKKFGKSKQK
jgi:hypothetical protein